MYFGEVVTVGLNRYTLEKNPWFSAGLSLYEDQLSRYVTNIGPEPQEMLVSGIPSIAPTSVLIPPTSLGFRTKIGNVRT